jgi:replicative DNA helicase
MENNFTKKALEKLPPQNIEAEQSLLGSLLIDKDSITKIADIIMADDFYQNAHTTIYNTILELYEKKDPIDLLSLSSRLEELGQLESIGGRSYLVQLTNLVPSAAHVVNYAKIIQKKATLRRLIAAAGNILELGYQEDREVDEVLDKSEQSIFSVSQKFLKEKFTHIKEVLTGAFDRIDELHREKGKLRGLANRF